MRSYLIFYGAISFPLSTVFIVSHKFGCVLPPFLLNFRMSLISYLTQRSLSGQLFNFDGFISFLVFLLLLKSRFNPWWFVMIQDIIWIFMDLLKLVCDHNGERCDNFGDGSMKCWEESILLCLYVIFFICILGPFDHNVC